MNRTRPKKKKEREKERERERKEKEEKSRITNSWAYFSEAPLSSTLLPSTTPRGSLTFFFFHGGFTPRGQKRVFAFVSVPFSVGRGGHARNSILYEWCEYYDGHAFKCQIETMGKVLIARKQGVFFTNYTNLYFVPRLARI